MKKKILVLSEEILKEKEGYINLYHPELVNQFLKKNQNLKFIDSFSENMDERKKHLLNFINLKNNLFIEFCEKLNIFFKKNFSDEVWRIIYGPWFHFAFEVFYNRFFSIKQLLIDQNLEYVCIEIPEKIENFASRDTGEFIYNINNKNWNAFIYKIFLDAFNIKYKINEKSKIDNNLNKKKKKNKYLEKIFNCYNSIAINFNNSLVVDTSLPKITNFVFQLKLRNIPIFRFPDNFKEKNVKKYSKELREQFLLSYIQGNIDKEQKIFKKLLINSIPLSLFENFKSFYSEIKNDKNLNDLKYIMTSQNYDENEYFKYIAAVNKENNNKLLYIQHGNVDGTSNFDSYDNTQLTSSNFFTWGYRHRSKHVPLFNVRVSGKSKINKGSKIGDHLIFYSLNRPIKRFFWDTMNLYNQSFNDQFYFIKSLSKIIQDKTLVKLHNTLDLRKKIIFENELKKINSSISLTQRKEILKKSKIAIFSYDSTGFYEHLSLNYPVVGLWKDCLENVNNDSREYYLALKNAGLISENYLELSKFLNKNWNTIEDWWFSKNVQDAVNFFISRYSVYEKNPIKTFTLKVKNIVNN